MLNSKDVYFGAPFGFIIFPEASEHFDRFGLNSIPTLLSITNLQQNSWVYIDDQFSYTVNSSPVEELVNILTGASGYACSGGNQTTPNGPILLNADRISSITYAKWDHFFTSFTLLPGKTEFFPIEYRCANPGRYSVTVTIPYQRAGKASNFTFQQQIVCPKKVTGWYIYTHDSVPWNWGKVLNDYLKLGDFEWTTPEGYYKLDYLYPR